MPPGLAAITIVHVMLSLVGIGSGIVVLFGMLAGRAFDRWTGIFLWSTALTSATGFLFPFEKLLPSHILAILSLILLAVAIPAIYIKHLAGAWRRIYVVTAMLCLYFNVFVLIVQLFEKVPALKELAPTQSEPPFAVTQLIVLVAFLGLIVLAAVRFRPAPVRAA